MKRYLQHIFYYFGLLIYPANVIHVEAVLINLVSICSIDVLVYLHEWESEIRSQVATEDVC